MDRVPAAERFDEGPDLPLVVDGAAGDHTAAMGTGHDRRLEGWAVPKLDRVGRLDIVMAVIEQMGRGAAGAGVMGDDNRMARRVSETRFKAECREFIGERLAGAARL